MFCASCGTGLLAGATFCGSCGTRQGQIHGGGHARVSERRSAPGGASYELAQFWPRLGAFILDNAIYWIPAAVVGGVVAVLIAVMVAAGQSAPVTAAQEQQQLTDVENGAITGFYLGFLPVYFLYHWIGTALGGGFGKRICGIRVVDQYTITNPGYGKAFGRVLMSFVSRFALYLGYLWPLWDSEKRTWHDMACGTVVVKADSIAYASAAMPREAA
jgi:uncharacterized RDD family membrane protein YckC